jgi:uroporphyrin-III C-methyltransferase
MFFLHNLPRTAYKIERIPVSHVAPHKHQHHHTLIHANRRIHCKASLSPEWYQSTGGSVDDFLTLWRQHTNTNTNTIQAPTTISNNQGPGTVYLVGTGPGDPGLLTLRALRLLQTADVVLYDRLVGEDVLELIGPSTLAIYVGKQKGYHTRTQEEIQELLGAFATNGASTVVRLKGGDPFIFGRGGEEAAHLASLGVQVKVVPGITAASGISAELGIPLTHRGVATSVRFLTGHAKEGSDEKLDETIATAAFDPHTTLVIYMGLATLQSLADRVIKYGLSADTPAVAVERGTTVHQRAVYARLDGLAEEVVGKHALQSPTLIIIGKSVALSAGWERFEKSGSSLDTGFDISVCRSSSGSSSENDDDWKSRRGLSDMVEKIGRSIDIY